MFNTQSFQSHHQSNPKWFYSKHEFELKMSLYYLSTCVLCSCCSRWKWWKWWHVHLLALDSLHFFKRLSAYLSEAWPACVAHSWNIKLCPHVVSFRYIYHYYPYKEKYYPTTPPTDSHYLIQQLKQVSIHRHSSSRHIYRHVVYGIVMWNVS